MKLNTSGLSACGAPGASAGVARSTERVSPFQNKCSKSTTSPRPSGDAGTALWKFSTKGTIISSAALAADGTLYTASMDGKAYVFHDTKSSPPPDAPSLSRTWYGQFRIGAKEDQVVAVLMQKGADVAGVVRLKSGLRGALDGKLQGNQATFNVTLREPDCPAKLSGIASAAPSAIEGKFQGQDCKGQPVQGSFKLIP